MLVIGLVGGTVEKRNEFAEQVVSLDQNNISTFVPPGCATSLRRSQELQLFIDVESRETKGKALVLPHMLTIEEALYIRKIGGYLWHMQGHKSCVIPIVWGDLMVTPKVGGDADHPRYLEAGEAFHQTLMVHKARPNAA
jgi:hypothetical protein